MRYFIAHLTTDRHNTPTKVGVRESKITVSSRGAGHCYFQALPLKMGNRKSKMTVSFGDFGASYFSAHLTTDQNASPSKMGVGDPRSVTFLTILPPTTKPAAKSGKSQIEVIVSVGGSQ